MGSKTFQKLSSQMKIRDGNAISGDGPITFGHFKFAGWLPQSFLHIYSHWTKHLYYCEDWAAPQKHEVTKKIWSLRVSLSILQDRLQLHLLAGHISAIYRKISTFFSNCLQSSCNVLPQVSARSFGTYLRLCCNFLQLQKTWSGLQGWLLMPLPWSFCNRRTIDLHFAKKGHLIHRCTSWRGSYSLCTALCFQFGNVKRYLSIAS